MAGNRGGRELVAVTGAYGDALAALGAAAGKNSSSALGFHTTAETVRLRTTATVGLKRTLRHES